MDNYGRIQVRIARDKARRRAKKERMNAEYDNFDKVIRVQNYVEALNKCRKGVAWKGTVQEYLQNGVTEMHKVTTALKKGEIPKLASSRRIEIYERGKKRIIVPVTIKDRMTQRVLCDKALTPVLCRSLIYDNGASLAGKGVEFTRDRLEFHLRRAIAEYGNDFHALVFDFKSFFDSIPHRTCWKVLNEHFEDERIKKLVMNIICSYQEPEIMEIQDRREREEKLRILHSFQGKGICLGSQISQVMALSVPSKLDHFIKDKMRVKHYIRYMDDGVIFSNDKEFLHELRAKMREVATELGLTFNEKKTRVVRISRGFTFMKVRYWVTSEGKVIKKLTRSGITRMRRKLKKLARLVKNGTITLDDVYNSMQSWVAHSKVARSYHTLRSMLSLYYKLFGGYKSHRKYTKQGWVKNEILQNDKWREFRWNWNVA